MDNTNTNMAHKSATPVALDFHCHLSYAAAALELTGPLRAPGGGHFGHVLRYHRPCGCLGDPGWSGPLAVGGCAFAPLAFAAPQMPVC